VWLIQVANIPHEAFRLVIDWTSCDCAYSYPLCNKERFCSLVKLQKDVVGMALQIYLAHTGQRLQADPGLFTS
jgi:hypothetical protein